jgi:HK97 family phage prohead protease
MSFRMTTDGRLLFSVSKTPGGAQAVPVPGLSGVLANVNEKHGIKGFSFDSKLWSPQEALKWLGTMYDPGELEAASRAVATGDIKQIAQIANVKDSPMEFKVASDTKMTIEGFASTPALDSYRDVVVPSAFTDEVMALYMMFPIVCMNHDIWGLPVGQTMEWERPANGLRVLIEISKSAPSVWTLIKEGTLKAFSYMYGVKRSLRDEESNINTILEFSRLYEVSVVSIPANIEALFEVRKSIPVLLSGIGLDRQTKGGGPATGREEEDVMYGLWRMTRLDGGIAPPHAPVDAEQVDQKITTSITKLRTEVVGKDEMLKQLASIREHVQANSITPALLKEAIDKVEADFKAVIAENKRLTNAQRPALPFGADARSIGLTPLSGRKFEAVLVKENPGMMPEQVKALFYSAKATPLGAPGSEIAELQKIYQEANDLVVIAKSILRATKGTNFIGMGMLGDVWTDYQQIESDLRKAMAGSITGFGAEWLTPTVMSAEILQRIELELTLARAFPVFTMTARTFRWPFKGGRITGYKWTEADSDTQAKITASRFGTANVLFSAVGHAIRLLMSTEEVEDNITDLLPIARDEIVTQCIRMIEDAILNGDTAGTHQDSDVTLANDHRTSWDGLRKKALAAAGSKLDFSNAVPTAALMNNLRVKLGARGAMTRDLIYHVSARDFIGLMSDTAISTADKWGANAPWLTGFLAAIHGIALDPTEFSRIDLNASGVHDASVVDRGSVQLTHRPSFRRGTRRIVTVEAGKEISTQQIELVATQRMDFKCVYPNDTYPTVVGYNTKSL